LAPVTGGCSQVQDSPEWLLSVESVGTTLASMLGINGVVNVPDPLFWAKSSLQPH
jgi:hypothetical protein